MALEDNIAAAFARALGPMAENFGAKLGEAITEKFPDKLCEKLSGKEIELKTTIKIPDLTDK